MPKQGVWRVAPLADPLRPSRISESQFDQPGGNRFDILGCGILYFSTTLQGCFAETIARFRVSAKMRAMVADEWRQRGFMEAGSVSAEWRDRRCAVRVTADHRAQFLDVESARTHDYLTTELAEQLAALKIDYLDVPVVRGPDRRVTRQMCAWARRVHSLPGGPAFGGVRYISRLGDWECWAVFEDTGLVEAERIDIPVATPELVEIAQLYDLTIH
ncbi:RES domain-containing protein [Kitasatospora sp. NPDC001664]